MNNQAIYFRIYSEFLTWGFNYSKDGVVTLVDIYDNRDNPYTEEVTDEMQERAFEVARGAIPSVLGYNVEVKHFQNSHGQFAVRVGLHEMHLVTVSGRSPTPSNFLYALYKMDWAWRAAELAAAYRETQYAVEVRDGSEVDFIVHTRRNDMVCDYPITGWVTLNEYGEVEDFVIPLEDVVPVINAMKRIGIVLDDPDDIEEVELWIPDESEWKNPGEENLDGIL